MSVEEEEKRIADLFGIGEGEKLPAVTTDSLKTFHEFLVRELTFPFEAGYNGERLPEDWEDHLFKAKALVGIGPGDPETGFYGLFCVGRQGRRKVTLPLAEVMPIEEGRNHKLVEDYASWFWNYR